MQLYSFLIALHNLFRWVVLLSLLFSIYSAFSGWIKNTAFTKWNDKLRHYTATILHIQLTIGVILYFVSPVIDFFLKNFKEAVHIREIRFFGMEHSLMMFVAVICVTVGSMSAKRKKDDKSKFRTMAIWYLLALLIILSSIPWPFSGLSANRPYFRPF